MKQPIDGAFCEAVARCLLNASAEVQAASSLARIADRPDVLAKLRELGMQLGGVIAELAREGGGLPAVLERAS